MTVLDQYARLEATAVWRAGDAAQRRDVFVSLGEATLVLHDGKEMALGHWSLPAVRRLNPGRTPARYAPDAETGEEIEIEDATMIAAIDKVLTAVARRQPREGRLRGTLIIAGLVVVALIATLWMPSAFVRQTASIVPPASREAMGEDLLDELRPYTGAACRSRAGDLALARLRSRLLPDSDIRIAVFPAGIEGAAHVPGRLILLGRDTVEDFETPEVVAGYILVETARIESADPVAEVLEDAGIGATLKMLTRGTLPEDALKDRARALVAAAPEGPPDAATVAPYFSRAGVSPAPFAYALDVTGESVLPLIEAAAVSPGDIRPVLSDDDWVALQNICGD